MLGSHFLVDREVSSLDAVMFDIDDTLIGSRKSQIIQSTFDLLQFATILGYKIIIMTARIRDNDVIRNTLLELKHHDICFDEIYFTCNKGEKKRLLKYKFILSVGDQWSDLTDSENYIKLASEYSNEFKISS